MMDGADCGCLAWRVQQGSLRCFCSAGCLLQLCWSCVIHLVSPHFRFSWSILILMPLNPCDPRHFMHPPPWTRGWISVIENTLILLHPVHLSVYLSVVSGHDGEDGQYLPQCFCCLVCCGQETGKDTSDLNIRFFFIDVPSCLPSPSQLKRPIHLIRRCSIQCCLTPDIFTDTSLSQGSLVSRIRSSWFWPSLTLPLWRPLWKQNSELLNHDKPQRVAQSNSSEFLFYFLRVVVYAGSKTVFCVVCKASD